MSAHADFSFFYSFFRFLSFLNRRTQVNAYLCYMNKHLKLLTIICFFLGIVSCTSWHEPAVDLDSEPVIFPDYLGVTIPCNIAPLNFMVEDADRVQAVLYHGDSEIRIVGKEGVVQIPMKMWRELMIQAKGGSVEVALSVWNTEFPDGASYEPFTIEVSGDEIDPYIAYRLIEPGYRSWRQLGLFQRCLSSFEESVIVTNADDNETCLNCHHFPAYSSESMMFHARGKNGGTVLYHDGAVSMVKFNEIGPKKNTTYPAWHPGGRFIAFSSNTTRQTFYVHGQKPLEVYDYASDLLLYDTMTGEVITDARFMTAETLESFPAWSPDGSSLYYVAADVKKLPDEIEDMHYHLMRVSFDPDTRSFGTKIDTLYNAHAEGGSVSYPRISADGRYLLYTWSEYGTFPVWHQEADLKMLDLNSMQKVDVAVWNDSCEADSYHSWSSDGRWAVIGSRRLDGRYTRLYIAHMDLSGKPCKPFLLPQEDPRHNLWRLKSYNVPEFINGKVDLPDSASELFCPEK